MRKQKFVLCMLVLLLLFCPSVTFAGESATYVITEQELTQLETNLAKLKQQRAVLQTQFQQLKAQQELLDKQVRTLELQLTVSKERSTALETQLQTANESLKQYAKEEKAKRLRIKRQRNLAYTLVIGLLSYEVYNHIGK